MLPCISSANIALACSASSKTKLEVRNKGVECSRKFVRSWWPRIACVSNFSKSDMYSVVFYYFKTMGNGSGLLNRLSHRTIFFDRQTYSFPGFSFIYVAIKLEMNMGICKGRGHRILLPLSG